MTELTEHAVEDVITLVRRPIQPAAGETYREIGLRSFGRGIFHKDPVTAEAIGGKKVFEIQPGDLIFSNVFAWEGAVAIASEQEKGMIGSHRFMTHEVHAEVAYARYLLHYFCSGPGLNVIRSASPGSAGRNRTLGTRAFATKRILLPTLVEQHRIADKLDAAMSSIARVVQLKKESDALVHQHADSLLRSVDRVATLSSALHVDQDFVDVSSDEKYAVTGIYSFGKGLIKRPVIQGSETAYPRFARLRKGQVVMSKLNAWEGALAVVDESFSGTYVSPEYPVFSLNTDTADPEYIGHLLAWPELWSRLTPRGSMVRRKRTTPTTLLSTEVPLPPLEEQRRIAERLTLARRVAKAGAQQVADLEVLRKGLLDAAFSGRL